MKMENFNFSEIHWNTPPLNCTALSSPPAVTVAHASRAAKKAALLLNDLCSLRLSCEQSLKLRRS